MAIESLAPALRSALDPIAEEGIETVREQLILWLIRTRFDIGDADSYASILNDRELFPGTQVDAVLVTTRRDLIAPVYVVYAENDTELRERVSLLVAALRSEPSPEAQLAKRSARLRALFEPAADRRIADDIGRLVQCVCRGEVSPAVRRTLNAEAAGVADIDVIDATFIDALAKADQAPTAAMPPVTVHVDPGMILNLGIPGTDAIVTAIPAEQIATWAGIEERTLFDLNVRFGLGLNRVRRSLDAALRNGDAAEEFIAYHNGITAVCSDFRVTDSSIEIAGLSVVNGAQTVVAIHANKEHLAQGLRVLFKLVKAPATSDLAANIAIRSNTQNPVTSRNLRALDEVQARLEADLAEYGWVYSRRPSDKPTNERFVRNDDVAQLLCSIYTRKPALAVKRQVLFENPLYGEIFPSDIDPARVIFAKLLRDEVEAHKGESPDAYQKAWALTALTLVNMTAEAMRDDPYASKVLLDPGSVVNDPSKVRAIISPFVQAAGAVLRDRAESAAEKQILDDFKVAFKQTRTLGELALKTSKEYRGALRSAQS